MLEEECYKLRFSFNEVKNETVSGLRGGPTVASGTSKRCRHTDVMILSLNEFPFNSTRKVRMFHF